MAVQEVATIKLADLTLDPRCQLRERLDGATISDYAEAMKDGDIFPPIVCFFDGQTHWLADGFHRVHGAKLAQLNEVRAVIHNGDIREAIIFAASSNAKHGLRRTCEDKRKAARTLLEDSVWSKWSDREIARRINVSHPFVSQMRSVLVEHGVVGDAGPTRLAHRNGSLIEVDVTHNKQSQKTDQVPASSLASAQQELRSLVSRFVLRSKNGQRTAISRYLRALADAIDQGVTSFHEV